MVDHRLKSDQDCLAAFLEDRMPVTAFDHYGDVRVALIEADAGIGSAAMLGRLRCRESGSGISKAESHDNSLLEEEIE